MKLPIERITHKISYDELSHRVFSGEILCFSGNNSLLRIARKLIKKTYDTPVVQKAHEKFNRDEFLKRTTLAQQEFNTIFYKAIFAKWLEEKGLDIYPLYWDTLGLRVSPPIISHGGGFRSSVNVHRDTWGAGLQSQINWWAPIYPLANGRTFGFYLDYWQMPLANTTTDWSFKEYLAARKLSRHKGVAATYPSTPQALETPNTPLSLARIDCGEVLAFSSAHLHASIPNKTALTRFSFEIRTLSLEDVKTDRGAPNVDCDSKPPLYRLFKSVRDDSSLADSCPGI